MGLTVAKLKISQRAIVQVTQFFARGGDWKLGPEDEIGPIERGRPHWAQELLPKSNIAPR